MLTETRRDRSPREAHEFTNPIDPDFPQSGNGLILQAKSLNRKWSEAAAFLLGFKGCVGMRDGIGVACECPGGTRCRRDRDTRVDAQAAQNGIEADEELRFTVIETLAPGGVQKETVGRIRCHDRNKPVHPAGERLEGTVAPRGIILVDGDTLTRQARPSISEGEAGVDACRRGTLTAGRHDTPRPGGSDDEVAFRRSVVRCVGAASPVEVDAPGWQPD